jgi:hypothetical protein
MSTAMKVVGQSELDSIPLDPAARILQHGKIMVPAGRGSGAEISIPGRGIFSLDFAVEPNKQLLLMLLTDAQYKAILAGQKPEGDPLIRTTIDSVASVNYTLDPGEYQIFLLNDASTDTQFTFRATWRRLP